MYLIFCESLIFNTESVILMTGERLAGLQSAIWEEIIDTRHNIIRVVACGVDLLYGTATSIRAIKHLNVLLLLYLNEIQ